MLTETKTLSLIFLSPELGPFFFPFAGEIRVNYTKPKEYKALVVTKVLNDKSEKYSFVALETNITEIAPLTTSKFNMTIHSVKGGRKGMLEKALPLLGVRSMGSCRHKVYARTIPKKEKEGLYENRYQKNTCAASRALCSHRLPAAAAFAGG